mgnify:CR=1 FL=1
MTSYGDHMFNKVPVVVNSFNVELRQGIDYISTRQVGQGNPQQFDPESEAAGLIESCGSGVTGFAIGDRVTFDDTPGSGGVTVSGMVAPGAVTIKPLSSSAGPQRTEATPAAAAADAR